MQGNVENMGLVNPRHEALQIAGNILRRGLQAANN
jgi:hypothetical protein